MRPIGKFFTTRTPENQSDFDDEEDTSSRCDNVQHVHDTGSHDSSDGSGSDDLPSENRRQVGLAGGDGALNDVFQRSDNDDWLADFTHPRGQLIFYGGEEPTQYGIFSHYFDGQVIDLVERNR